MDRPLPAKNIGIKTIEQPLIFCPSCFARVPPDVQACPNCQASLRQWSQKSYTERLIQALHHPLATVRMGVIIALGLRAESIAEQPLVECAMRHPTDIIEGLEIINSLRRIRQAGGSDQGLDFLAKKHPANAVRCAAQEVVKAKPLNA